MEVKKIMQDTELRERLQAVRERIADTCTSCGRDREDVTLVAVSKFHPVSAISAVAEAGQTDFGENYIQESLAKQEELADSLIKWHFIGKLQSNKAKFAAGRFALIHTVESLKLAQALHKRIDLESGQRQAVLLQVNIGREDQKSGIMEEDLPELAEAVEGLDGIEMKGLMCITPFFGDPEGARPYFAKLRELRDGLEARLGRKLPHLSMGMSGDMSAAIEEGATIVRIGTDIFGSRPVKQ